MREYVMYWIKDEYSVHYFYKTNILFQFLKEWRDDKHHSIYHKQFYEITNALPIDTLIQSITRKLRQPVELCFDENEASFLIHHNGKVVQLTQKDDREIRLYAENLLQAEEMLFHALRTFHPAFFIIDTTYSHYGWIAPIKNRAIL
ncbi:sporulation inhibitor of replication protein SirA [Pontibacillus litoralis]|uniref:Sporulation inhibitor of replication protein SirA n=1 Tax=Pontibacillus litoralis JSM 072002 TaxID=1385512 RepID=A0A0A5G382_9BACI|nr:sporulation inhibitor of replication protein SirA [Pontibacillus litoralis]KGX87566.1 hypothetical protein N784_15070 [Pontibacillus litoralis JSM 072002]